MELNNLKKTVGAHINGIEKRLSLIESNTKKLNNWQSLLRSVTQNVQQTDESALKEMIGYFGEGCLKALIREVSSDYIKDFEDKITSSYCDLKTIIKHDTSH